MSFLSDDETTSPASVDDDIVLLSNILRECLLVYRGIVSTELSDLYIALRSALVLAIMLSDVDETDLCSEHNTIISGICYDSLSPKLPRRLGHRPRTRYRPWSRYRYGDNSECSPSKFLEDSDSVTSDCSFYESRRYLSEPLSSLGMVRPRKWLSLLLGLDFLDVLKKKKENRHRRDEKKPPRERPSMGFVVDPPENPCEEDCRRERRFSTARHRLSRVDSGLPELRRIRRSQDGRPRISENRDPREYRSRREVFIQAERRPPRDGRRITPDREFEVRSASILRELRSYWAQQIDRERERAFQETTTSRYTRVEEPIPNASTSAARRHILETRLPRQGGYACPNEPEATTIVHRTPRARARSPWPQRRQSRRVEERAPHVDIEERLPRTQPVIIRYGVGGLVDSGFEVVSRAQSRQDTIRVQGDRWTERETNRNTRRPNCGR